MLLQVMFVLKGFSTLTAFELAVSSSFIEQRRLQRDEQCCHMMDEKASLSRLQSCRTEANGEI